MSHSFLINKTVLNIYHILRWPGYYVNDMHSCSSLPITPLGRQVYVVNGNKYNQMGAIVIDWAGTAPGASNTHAPLSLLRVSPPPPPGLGRASLPRLRAFIDSIHPANRHLHHVFFESCIAPQILYIHTWNRRYAVCWRSAGEIIHSWGSKPSEEPCIGQEGCGDVFFSVEGYVVIDWPARSPPGPLGHNLTFFVFHCCT